MYYSNGTESVSQFANRLKDGAHLLRATFSGSVSASDDPKSRMIDIRFTIDRPWTLTQGPAVLPFDDPSKADEIRRCIKIEFSNKYGRLGPMPLVTVKSPPCPVAWDVTISTSQPPYPTEANGPIPHLACNTGQTATADLFFSNVRLPPDAHIVTITLTPSRTAAERAVDIETYWNGTLVFKDIQVGN
jgi:hypothetical protein